jgi:hypothetical protein
MSNATATGDTTLSGVAVRRRAPAIPAHLRSDVRSGIPWVAGIIVGAIVSYLVLRAIFTNVSWGPPPLMSIGTMLIGAAIATTFALAGGWPLHRMANVKLRASILLVVSLILSFAFWSIFSGVLKFSMANYSFPIIGTFWWFIAATSFVGEEAHIAHLSAERRTFLNLILWIGGTWLVVLVIGWIPPFWFGLVQTLLVTGGFAYLLRRIKQPIRSILAWATLALLTAAALAVSNAVGAWSASGSVSLWKIGSPTAEWGVFFGLWCGLNYGVLALIQCWPFSFLRQPLGSAVAVPVVAGVDAALSILLVRIFDAFYTPHATALLEAQVFAWHTVFWGFCFALLFGIGSKPYLWAGQRTPGTWEDIDEPSLVGEDIANVEEARHFA